MASLDNLTDEQLRDELKKYGINAAVTKSTRIILRKKLNHLRAGDLEKLSDINVIKTRKRSSVKNAKSLKVLQKDIVSKKDKITHINPIKSRARTSHGASILNNFSSDEDATEPEDEIYEPICTRAGSRRSSRNNDSMTLSSFKKSFLSSTIDNNSSFGKKFVPLIKKKSKYSYLTSPNTVYSSEESQINQSRNSNQDLYDTGSDSDLNPLDETDYYNRSPGSSSLLLKDRLSGRNKNIQRNNLNFGSKISNSFHTDFNCNNDLREEVEIINPDDVVSQESMISAHLGLSNGQNSFNHTRKSIKEKSWNSKLRLPSIPILLLILFAMFFCILGFCYVSMNGSFLSNIVFSMNFGTWSPDMISFSRNIDTHKEDTYLKNEMAPAHEETSSKFPICLDQESIKLSCLSKAEAEGVPDLLLHLEDTILPCLLHQAKLYQCHDLSNQYLDTEAIATIVKDTNIAKTKADIILGLHGLAKLTRLHSNLGIDSFWENNDTPVLLGLAVKNPPKEVMCHIVALFYSCINILIVITLVVIISWVAFQIFKYRKKCNDEYEQKLFELVEQILEILENSCGDGNQDFVAVNHVRDCFIPPRDREAKAEIWKRAVSYIDSYDSRVYRDVRSVGGEEHEVWRWVSGAPKTPPEKIWQGQAFESLENTHNVPQVSLTSCLKIRSMFDSDIEFGDNWPCRIQDSLLEKCEGIDIVHITVDRLSKEGCVYIKCANSREAGKAFRSLHGWWFDGNLVTVKYLRDERYQERFPAASNARSPLKPSNNKRLSLPTEPEANKEQPRTSTRKGTTLKSPSRYS